MRFLLDADLADEVERVHGLLVDPQPERALATVIDHHVAVGERVAEAGEHAVQELGELIDRLHLVGRLLELLLQRRVGQRLGGLLDQLAELRLVGEAEGVLQHLLGVGVRELAEHLEEGVGVELAADHVHAHDLEPLRLVVEFRIHDDGAGHGLEAEEGRRVVAVVPADDPHADPMLDHLRDQLGPGPEGLREIVQLRELERPAEDRVGEPGLLDVVAEQVELAARHLVGVILVLDRRCTGKSTRMRSWSCQPPSCGNSCEKGQPERQNRRPGP